MYSLADCLGYPLVLIVGHEPLLNSFPVTQLIPHGLLQMILFWTEKEQWPKGKQPKWYLQF